MMSPSDREFWDDMDRINERAFELNKRMTSIMLRYFYPDLVPNDENGSVEFQKGEGHEGGR
jgi:hypothetical protein